MMTLSTAFRPLQPLAPASNRLHGRPVASRIAPFVLVAMLAACASQAEKDAATPVEKLYADAMEDAESGSYDRAIKQLDRIEGKAAGTLLAQQAQLELAYLYWKTADKVQALATLDRFIKLHTSSPALDYALYLRGLVNFAVDLGFMSSLAGQSVAERDQQAARESYQSFRQLVDQFPNSRYASDAAIRMDYTVNMLAESEVRVAAYYLRRGAYVAAVNRAKQAVTEFPQTDSIPQALAIMVVGYDKLGLPQLRDDTKRVLDTNFPGNSLAEAPKKNWWHLW